MSADLRRFDYPLEPLRRLRQWQLDAVQRELGRVATRLEEVAAERARLEARLQEASADAAAPGSRLDLARRSRLLAWMGQLRDSLRDAEARTKALEVERAAAMARCAARQRDVEVLDRHRDDSLLAFAREEAGREAREADRDWLSRPPWSSGSAHRSSRHDAGGGER